MIYVVDPEDEKSLAQAKSDLLIMTSEEELRYADFTVVCMYQRLAIHKDFNKADIIESLDPDGLYFSERQ